MGVKGLFADTGLEPLKWHGRTLKAEIAEAITDARLSRTIEGASTLTVTLNDPDYELLHSKLLTERVACNLDGLTFELVQVNKAGSTITATFEDGLVADLRDKRGPGPVARPGTTSRTAFARRLVSEVKYAKFRGAPTVDAKVALSRGGKGGGSKRENSWDCLQRLASDRAWRCFVAEEVVYFGPDSWLLGLGQPFVISERSEGVDRIDWDYDRGKRAQSATVTCWVKRWGARPGVPVEIEGQGPLCRGLWLVSSIERSLYSQQATVSLARKTPGLPEPKPPREAHDDSQSDGTGGGSTGKGSKGGWQWPADGPITSDWGAPRSYGGHTGIDIGIPNGTPIRAMKGGTVVFAGVMGGYGNCIDVDHGGGIKSRYAHLQSFKVRSGHDVGAGQVIALSNNTGASSGPHLHFGIYVNGAAVDPKRFLP